MKDLLSQYNISFSLTNFSNGSNLSDELLQEYYIGYKSSLLTIKEPTTIILVSLYAIIFTLALFGNILVLLVIILNKHMKSVTNYFLVNLICADLLVTVICMPLTVGEIVYEEWIYGLFLCKTTAFLQGVSVSASVFTISALSFERYIALKHSLLARRIMNNGLLRKVIMGIWFCSIVIMIPLILVKQLKIFPLLEFSKIVYCHEVWPKLIYRRLYDFCLFLFIYIFPGIMIIASYSTTGFHLMNKQLHLQTKLFHSHGSCRVLIMRRQVAKMLFLLAILFAVSWLPYYTILMYMDFSQSHSPNLMTTFSFALLLGHTHCAQNPFIYFFMNHTFRRSMINMLTCNKYRRESSNSKVEDYLYDGAENAIGMSTLKRNNLIVSHRTIMKDRPPMVMVKKTVSTATYKTSVVNIPLEFHGEHCSNAMI